jgi:hypothetical protein
MSAISSASLTAADDGVVVYEDNKRIGCIIRLASGLTAAWDLHKKLGEYETLALALAAVREAFLASQKGKRK